MIDSRQSTLKTLLLQNTESHSRLTVLGFTPHVHTPTGSLRTGHLLSTNCNYPKKHHRDSGRWGDICGHWGPLLQSRFPAPSPGPAPTSHRPCFPLEISPHFPSLRCTQRSHPLLGLLGGAPAGCPGTLRSQEQNDEGDERDDDTPPARPWPAVESVRKPRPARQVTRALAAAPVPRVARPAAFS